MIYYFLLLNVCWSINSRALGGINKGYPYRKWNQQEISYSVWGSFYLILMTLGKAWLSFLTPITIGKTVEKTRLFSLVWQPVWENNSEFKTQDSNRSFFLYQEFMTWYNLRILKRKRTVAAFVLTWYLIGKNLYRRSEVFLFFLPSV